MIRSTPHGRLATAVALIAAALCAGPAARADAPDPSEAAARAIEPAISHPSQELKLAFAAPGVVREVLVKEGDHVTADQPLAQQDDREEQEALKSLQLDADSTAEIDYEKADVAQKSVALQRKQTLFDQPGGNASQSELDDAKLAVALARAQVLVSEQKHTKSGFDAAKQRIKVERMRLRSPVEGVVQRVFNHPGEMADPSSKDGAIVVVKNDPLWVEIHPATDRALKLRLGQPLDVRYATPAGDAGAWQSAKVIYFAPQADASSKTELVRLELSNPGGQRSGLSMEVKLPADVAAVAANGNGAAGAAGTPAMPPLAN